MKELFGPRVYILLLAAAAFGCDGATADASDCSYDGKSYDEGDAFPSSDGCNTCSCMRDGNVACTARACLSCDDISAMYAALMEQAKACDADDAQSCGEKVVAGLHCSCETFVDASGYDAEAARSLEQLYSAADCGEGIVCGPCLAPASAHCSVEGLCVDDG